MFLTSIWPSLAPPPLYLSRYNLTLDRMINIDLYLLTVVLMYVKPACFSVYLFIWYVLENRYISYLPKILIFFSITKKLKLRIFLLIQKKLKQSCAWEIPRNHVTDKKNVLKMKAEIAALTSLQPTVTQSYRKHPGCYTHVASLTTTTPPFPPLRSKWISLLRNLFI